MPEDLAKAVLPTRSKLYPDNAPVNFTFKGNFIKTYRHPPNPNVEYKGRIYYIHGFSESGGKWSEFAEMYANKGYDFFTMD